MASLEESRFAAQMGDSHVILGVDYDATVAQIDKARRSLQRDAHHDKGGSLELSQLINDAADHLRLRSPELAQQRVSYTEGRRRMNKEARETW